jgi:microcin C transport system substrate-binding protein
MKAAFLYFKHFNIIFVLYLCIFIIQTSLAYATSKQNEKTYASYAHGFSYSGQLKYTKNFLHFNYVNTFAPKQATLTLNSNSLFDKFNPFSLKGQAAPAITLLMFDTLMTASLDEQNSMYGLIANGIRIDNNGMRIVFQIDPNARFNNQDAIQAKDVKYSFDMLMQHGAPTFGFMYADIQNCRIIDTHTIEFNLKQHNKEMPILLGNLPIFSSKWVGNADFSKLNFTVPIASGPYLIDKYYQGRSITYKLNPNYWAKNHATRKGMFNFQNIRFEVYQDDVARLEAFKSGNFDAIVEYRAKNWAKAYTGKLFAQKKLIKQNFAHQNGNGMQGFVFNMRKNIFKDIKVRQALSLALDFDWMNKQLFYNAYMRLNSYFTNSIYAADMNINDIESISSIEKQYFNALDIQKIPHIPQFYTAQKLNNTEAALKLRQNLLQAQQLLEQAGWKYKDGFLRNAKGQIFTFEIAEVGESLSRVISAYKRNLNKLGIEVKESVLDPAIYQKRLETFDFDMVSVRYPDTSSPGNELINRFSSKAASTNGSDNIIGIADKRIDKMLDIIVQAKTQVELTAATKVLDRLLLSEYYIIPHWYSNTHRIGYSAALKYPQNIPLYYDAETWLIATWWK